MEYLFGAFLAFISMMITITVLKPRVRDSKTAVKYSQSHIFSLIDPFIPANSDLIKQKTTQATNYYDNMYIRIAYVGKKAYWIHDNSFFVADIVNGEVDDSTTRQVDTMSMSQLELNQMLYIIEELTGGSNDNRNSGN